MNGVHLLPLYLNQDLHRLYYRKVNSLTKKDSYSLPRVEECIICVGNAKFIKLCLACVRSVMFNANETWAVIQCLQKVKGDESEQHTRKEKTWIKED